MPGVIRYSITEITVLTGRKKAFKLNVNGVDVRIPVDQALFAQYQNKFVRVLPTRKQRNAFTTLIGLMRAAYEKGWKDGKRQNR